MPTFQRSARQWLSSLKLRIVLLSVATGMLAAAGTAAVVLHHAAQSIERLVLETAREDRERNASLLGSKVSVLRDLLVAVAAATPPQAWADARAMGGHLRDETALGAVYTTVFAAAADGRMLAWVKDGKLAAEMIDISDRSYFRQAMATDQPVVSDVVWGRMLKAPVVVIAVPVLDAGGRHLGVLAGSLSLSSAALFSELRAASQDEGVQDVVIDRAGRILAHQDPARLMQPAEDEAALRAPVRAWLASGSPIDTLGVASIQGGHVVSMAGIPLTDWLNIRVTSRTQAMLPVAEARAAALPAAMVAGLAAAALAGLVGYAITRPISRLHARIQSLLHAPDGATPWPDEAGEVGRLAHAFQHVVQQRERRQSEVQSLLLQLEAVLDHADVGIALTRSGSFELVSRQFCQIFRCNKVDAIGQATRMIYPSDEAFDALVAQARPALSTHGVVDAELQLMRRTGQVFWARLRGRAVAPGDVSQGTIWTIEDVTAAREHRERLAWRASHDALTGLVNRAAFERLLEAATQADAGEPFCALFIDLDRFKQVNDTGGHAAGDALLRDIGQILARHVRKSDTVARLGGDEFAVLLHGCTPGQAAQIANTLCTQVQAYTLVWQGQRHAVGASVGLVVAGPGFGTPADVLRAADSACYQAKKRGRNRVETFQATDLADLADPGAWTDMTDLTSA